MLTLNVNKAYLDPDRYETVGMVSVLLSGMPDWRGDLRHLINEEVLPAYRHRHFRFFYLYDQIPVGFITWAYLSPETETRILSTLDPWLHISEWNEGPSLWIKYLYLPREYRELGIRLFLGQLFPQAQSVRALLERKDRRMAIELDRETLARYGALAKRFPAIRNRHG